MDSLKKKSLKKKILGFKDPSRLSHVFNHKKGYMALNKIIDLGTPN